MPARIRKRPLKLPAYPEAPVILPFEKVYPEAECEFGNDLLRLSGHAWLRLCLGDLVSPVRK
jgi:hypothetical protein